MTQPPTAEAYDIAQRLVWGEGSGEWKATVGRVLSKAHTYRHTTFRQHARHASMWVTRAVNCVTAPREHAIVPKAAVRLHAGFPANGSGYTTLKTPLSASQLTHIVIKGNSPSLGRFYLKTESRLPYSVLWNLGTHMWDTNICYKRLQRHFSGLLQQWLGNWSAFPEAAEGVVMLEVQVSGTFYLL